MYVHIESQIIAHDMKPGFTLFLTKYQKRAFHNFRCKLGSNLPEHLRHMNICQLLNLILICPCIVNIIPNYNQQDATFLNLFISTEALHVLGGSSANHQEHIIVHTASGIVNQYCCLLQQATVLYTTVHYPKYVE